MHEAAAIATPTPPRPPHTMIESPCLGNWMHSDSITAHTEVVGAALVGEDPGLDHAVALDRAEVLAGDRAPVELHAVEVLLRAIHRGEEVLRAVAHHTCAHTAEPSALARPHWHGALRERRVVWVVTQTHLRHEGARVCPGADA
jgi:hypothetical protein